MWFLNRVWIAWNSWRWAPDTRKTLTRMLKLLAQMPMGQVSCRGEIRVEGLVEFKCRTRCDCHMPVDIWPFKRSLWHSILLWAQWGLFSKYHGLDLLLFYVKIFSFIIFLIDAHLTTPVVVVVLEMLYMFGAWDLTRASKQPPRAP